MPRKPTPEPYEGPPGELRMEVRVNDKIVFLQRVHGYTIDQQTDQVVVHGSLRPAPSPAQEPAPEPVEESPEPAEL